MYNFDLQDNSMTFIMKRFKLSSFFELGLGLLLMLQQVKLGLCDLQFHYSKNEPIKNQIDLECFSNNTEAITTNIYEYIFPLGGDLSKLGMLHVPDNSQSKNFDTEFVFLELLNKDIGLTCLTFNKRVSSSLYKHAGKRSKRNSNSNIIYIQQKIILRCFNNQPNDIDSFKWDFSDGQSISASDYYDEPTKYDIGEKKGDMILKNYARKAVNVTCKPVIEGRLSVGNSYQLIPLVLPEPPFIELDGKLVVNKFEGQAGCYNFTCKSFGGIPDPELSFILKGMQLMSLNKSVIVQRICINSADNGVSLICKSSHIGQDEPWEKEEKIAFYISDDLSGGIIAAICVSILVIVAVLAIVIVYILRKKHSLNKTLEYRTSETEEI